MKKDAGNKSDFGSPCVSLIIPTHKTSDGRRLDPLEVKKHIKDAKTSAVNKFGAKDAMSAVEKLEHLTEQIDYNHNENGLGLYVSEQGAEIVKFPFEVKTKLRIDNDLLIRDRLYFKQVNADYFVLDLTLNCIRLFKGNGTVLKEIKDNGFPAVFFDDYEYEKAAPGSSNGYALKSTEQDQSVIKSIRFVSFVKRTDKLLSHYPLTSPLIITGVERDLGYFMKHSSHAGNVVGQVIGNYNDSVSKLGEMTFKKIREYFNQQERKALEQLDESMGLRKAVTGITDCWRAAKEGKGLLLLIEKDLFHTGYVSRRDVYTLFLNEPEDDFEVVEDAAEAIIKTILEKKGKVLFFENNTLAKYQGIALIERYS